MPFNQIALHYSTFSLKTKDNLNLSLYFRKNLSVRKTRSYIVILSDSRATSRVFKLIQFEILKMKCKKNLKIVVYNYYNQKTSLRVISRAKKDKDVFESTKGRFEATSIRLFCPKGHIKMSVLNDRHFSLVTIFRVICADLFHLNVMFIYFISCPNIPPIPVNEEDNKNMKCDLS